MPAPFDGYVEEVARVSSTCLVSMARNRVQPAGQPHQFDIALRCASRCRRRLDWMRFKDP